MKRLAVFASVAYVTACAAPSGVATGGHTLWTPRPAPGVTASLRGLSVVSADLVWASGSESTVLTTADGGRTWQVRTVAEAAGADLRSIHGFDAEVAVAATAGTPARVLRTTDGGATWEVVYEVRDRRAFLDSLGFADRLRGYLFGDPLDATAHFVLATGDGGRSWRRLAGTPAPIAGEAGFAASGTCIDAHGALVRIGTGGARARVLLGIDAGRSWSQVDVPLLAGDRSQGVFSIAFTDARRGVVVGGDYLDPERRDGTAAFTVDGGLTWTVPDRGAGGYRSAAAFAPGFGTGAVIAVGTNGADISLDAGRTWAPVPGGAARAHHAIGFAPEATVGYAVGDGGRITRITR